MTIKAGEDNFAEVRYGPDGKTIIAVIRTYTNIKKASKEVDSDNEHWNYYKEHGATTDELRNLGGFGLVKIELVTIK